MQLYLPTDGKTSIAQQQTHFKSYLSNFL